MFKHIRARIKSYFKPVQVKYEPPKLELTRVEMLMNQNPYGGFYPLGPNSDEAIQRRNAQRIEMTKLKQQEDSTNSNLLAQHRIMIATLITALAAVLSAIVALVISLHQQAPVVQVNVPKTSQHQH